MWLMLEPEFVPLLGLLFSESERGEGLARTYCWGVAGRSKVP